MSRILVVDDEPAIGWTLREFLADQGHEVAVAASAEEALDTCDRFGADAILLDVRLPGRDGIAAMPDLRVRAPAAPVIVMTAFGDLDTAVRAVQAGAFDYLLKPFDLDRVATAVARAVADRAAAALPAAGAHDGDPLLVGAAPVMQEVFTRIALVAATDLPVLVTGAAGTGKELAARVIHARSARGAGPFVATSLAALAPGAVESELCGEADRPGLVELAGGGTLFLDEIHAAPAAVQARLARLIETGTVSRAGAAEPRPAAVRLMAATDADLDRLVAAGSFRADLLDRLRAGTLTMPSLAARTGDVEALVGHFLGRQAVRLGRSRTPAVTDDFLAALRARSWPGNVRELRQAVEFAAVVSRGQALGPEHLPPVAPAVAGGAVEPAAAGVADAVRAWSAAARRTFGALPEPDLHHRLLKLAEAALIRETLASTGGNRTASAKLLGLDRATLRTKLRLLGLDD